MKPEDLLDEARLRTVLVELHNQIRGSWDTGKWEPGLANFVEQMLQDARDAKAAAIEAASLARANEENRKSAADRDSERSVTNRRWLISIFLTAFTTVALKAYELIAAAQVVHK